MANVHSLFAMNSTRIAAADNFHTAFLDKTIANLRGHWVLPPLQHGASKAPQGEGIP